MNREALKQKSIVLFDGICNLCNGSVIFILQRERQPSLQFASIQSEIGQELLEWCGYPKDYKQAILLIDKGKVYAASTAVLKIGGYLKFPWSKLSSVGLLVPRFIRDWVYNQIARHRYKWFGKRDVCMVPTEKLKARFL